MQETDETTESEEQYKNLCLSLRLEQADKNLGFERGKNFADLANYISPHLVGKEWEDIRKSGLLMLVSELDTSKTRHRMHELLIGKPGTGKSIDGDTPVIIRYKNNIEIHKIKDTEKITDFEALSVNPTTLNVEWKKVNKVSKHEEGRKVLKITTRRKQEVIATIDHSFLKYDFERDRLVPMRGNELKEGDLIPFISEMPVKISNTEYSITLNHIGIEELRKKAHIWRDRLVKILPLEQYKKRGSMGWQIPYEDAKVICPNLKPKKIVFPLDYDFGFLTGFWLAEGDMDEKRRKIHFSNTNKNILKYIQATLKKIPAQGNRYSGGCISQQRTCWRLCVQNTHLFDFLLLFIDKEIYNYLRGVKGVGRGARSKMIPSICFNFSNEFVSGVLCGYFTGDGTVGNNISATTASKKLASGISMLLLKLKIGNYIKIRDDYFYKIMIPSYFARRFSEQIGFVGENRKKIEDELKCGHKNTTIYIPMNYDFFRKNTKGMMSDKYKNIEFIRDISKYSRKGYLSKHIAKRFNKIIGSKTLKKLIDSGIYWTPIKKIEEIKSNGYVYDFSVQDNENFVLANGMVVHNTEMMLWWREKLQGILINGEFVSKAGLTGDARGKKVTKGLLSEYNGNFVLIDELDKMNLVDQNSLLQSMEEGQYFIVKGKHREPCVAEIRVIGSTNDLSKIQRPLLDRFDFVYHCKTSTRAERAENVSRITKSFFGDSEAEHVHYLKGYLSWVGDYNPTRLPSDVDAIDHLIETYIVDRREIEMESVSYRSLEYSILRIAWGIAKLQKKNVTDKEVMSAIIFKDRILRWLYPEGDNSGKKHK